MNPNKLLAITVLLLSHSFLNGSLMAAPLPLANVTVTGYFDFKVTAKERDGLRPIEDVRIESGTLPRTGFGERWDFAALDVASAHSTPFWDQNPPYGYNAYVVNHFGGLVHSGGFGFISTYFLMSGSPYGANRWGNAFPAELDIKSSVFINGNLGQQTFKYNTPGTYTRVFVDGLPLHSFPGDPDNGYQINVTRDIEFRTNYRYQLHPNLDQFGSSDSLYLSNFGTIHWGLQDLPGTAPGRPLSPEPFVGSETIGGFPDPNALVFTCLEGLDEYFYEVGPRVPLSTESEMRIAAAENVTGQDFSFDVLDEGPGFALLKLHELDGPLVLTVSIGSQHFAWDGLEAFDFLAIDPNGVKSFFIMGEGFDSFEDLPVFSTKFAAGGVVRFKVAVPECRTMILFTALLSLSVSISFNRGKRRFACGQSL